MKDKVGNQTSMILLSYIFSNSTIRHISVIPLSPTLIHIPNFHFFPHKTFKCSSCFFFLLFTKNKNKIVWSQLHIQTMIWHSNTTIHKNLCFLKELAHKFNQPTHSHLTVLQKNESAHTSIISVIRQSNKMIFEEKKRPINLRLRESEKRRLGRGRRRD